MRAIYLEKYSKDETILINDKTIVRHLSSVIRLKKNEEVLILNGKGDLCLVKTLEVSKNQLSFSVMERKSAEDKRFIDVAVCITKKDAFDLMLKSATELGVRNFIPVDSQYSQKRELNLVRSKTLIESALVQSNNAFLLNLEKTISFSDLPRVFESYDHILYFSSLDNSKQLGPKQIKGKCLIIIGPEGGLSETEENMLLENSSLETIHLPCPILRSPTALMAGIGVVYERMQKV